MQELIQITTGGQGSPVVSARELHEFLEVKSRFNDWIKNRINKYRFNEGADFITLTKILVSGGNETDYALTLDMAKELAMVERNEKGKQARQYFIEKEKELNALAIAQAPLSTEQLLLQTLSQQTQLLAENQQMIAQLRADVNSIQRGHKPDKPQPAQPTSPGFPPVVGDQLRRRIRERVTGYCAYHQADYSETYTYLYKRLHDIYGVNVHRLNRIGTETLLDTIERYGRLGDLYKIARNELNFPEVRPGRVPGKKPSLDTMSEEDLQAILRRTFYQDDHLRYPQLRANLIEASEYVGLALSKGRAEVFIARALKLGYLRKGWVPGHPFERYQLDQTRLSL